MKPLINKICWNNENLICLILIKDKYIKWSMIKNCSRLLGLSRK